MLIYFYLRKLCFAALTLLLLAGCARGSGEAISNSLVIYRQETVNRLEEAENHGIRIYLEEGFAGDKFVEVTVCVEQTRGPDNVSAFFLLSLSESPEAHVEDMLLSISQRMSKESARSEFDLGKFRIRIDLLRNVFLLLGHSDRDTGLLGDDGSQVVEVSFGEIFDELMSPDWTYSADFDEISCQLPSGRYIHET